MIKQLSIPSLEEYNYLPCWYIFGQQSQGAISAFLGPYANQREAEKDIKLLKAWLEVKVLLDSDLANQVYIDWRKDSSSVSAGIYNKQFRRDRKEIVELVEFGDELVDILVSGYKSIERRLSGQQEQRQSSPKITKDRLSAK